MTSTPGPGRINEDHVTAGPSWVVVLDGATAPAGVDSGCIHDVRWFVDHLGAAIAGTLIRRPRTPLPDVLATGIDVTRGAHDATCDLSNPDSPSATVALLRRSETTVDYLVLADATVVFDAAGEIRTVTDDRIDHLPSYTAASVSAQRNQPGGFWVASTDLRAVHEALVGRVPLTSVNRAAAVTDGASRFVDLLDLGDWSHFLDVLDTDGPAAIIRQIRLAETTTLGPEPRGPHGRRIKRHDDATAVFVRF